jgi:hypothetical protein
MNHVPLSEMGKSVILLVSMCPSKPRPIALKSSTTARTIRPITKQPSRFLVMFFERGMII